MSMMQRVRAKICGLTRIEDVQSAVDAGADAVGFVFYPPSPRAVTASQAQSLALHVPAYVQIVGLFVNATTEDVQTVLQSVPLDVIQFHGDESPADCQRIANRVGRRWYKAIQVKADLDVVAEIEKYHQVGAGAVLLDAWHPELKGSTGQPFD